jgi:ATP-dependent RNA helicase HelY
VGSDEPTPSERYAAARRRAAAAKRQLHDFRQEYDFLFDDFQVTACEALEDGRSVLVAAPTGAGKTVVGEFAVWLARQHGSKCFYTTPIKALSNQKFSELVQRYGAAQVGLLTGDNSINGEADIVVMTTEVLRNMIYAGSRTLDRLGFVVMDEVHYLADRTRGAVWEEVLIHLPQRVASVSLSATVSNAEEFGDWLTTVRGDTCVVVEEQRPVPLWQHVMAGSRLHDLTLDGDRVNPELAGLARDESRAGQQRRGKPKRGQRRNPRSRLTPSRVEVVERLRRDQLLPAITFIFSRAGCDAAVQQCLAGGLRLTRPQERAEIRTIAEQQCAHIPAADLDVLGYDEWLAGLQRGIAAHHAGQLPAFKETVELLFQRGLIKAVFATETLALGINMPARSVVLERLSKWNGEQHVALSPGEYTQLTGRAGRRGIDIEGHAVVVWQADLDPGSLAGLAATRTYPLRSSFRPSYNMAVNLLAQQGRSRARELLETSFAQFQADRAVVGLAAEIRRNEEALDGYAEAMTCHLGDFAEYADLRQRLNQLEKDSSRRADAQRRADAEASLRRLRSGDVIILPARRRAGPVVILDPGTAPMAEPRPLVLGLDKRVRRLSPMDFPSSVRPVGRLRIPKHFQEGSATQRRHLAERLLQLSHSLPAPVKHQQPTKPALLHEIDDVRKQLRRHPCHGCDEREDHARWAERYHRLRRRTDALSTRVNNRTNTIARQFDRVCDVLAELGYVRGDGDALEVAQPGRMLAGIYGENDLLTAECIRRGLWEGLTAPELAAACAALVYESRVPDAQSVAPRLPGGAVPDVLRAMDEALEDLHSVEKRHQVAFLRPLDLGFCHAVHRWSAGARLEQVLWESELTPGDFVRWCKQVIDRLRQLEHLGEPELAVAARQAVAAINRSVVSYSAVA